MNQASSNGNTPLLWAVKMGFLLCTNALLGTPTIDVNASNREGKTALILAAEKGRVAILKQLLSAPGVDIGLVTLDGKTAEEVAGANNQMDVLLLIPGSRENVEAQISCMGNTLDKLKVGEGRPLPHCLVCEKAMVSSPVKPVVNCPTKWSLYLYLDLSDDHLYFSIHLTMHSTAMCNFT